MSLKTVEAPRFVQGLNPEQRVLRSSSLAHEVKRLKVAGIEKQGDWYLLPGTGFNVRSQVNQLRSDFREGFEIGRGKDEIVEAWLQKTEEDIKGFKLEYLMQGLVFPIVLDKKIVNGKERIIGSMYGDKPLVDTVSDAERNGSVKRSVEKIENFLLKAPSGSTAVMTSPSGWSGIPGVTYQDSQTYVFRVLEDGRPMGFTLRTDMNIDQNKNLLKNLGLEKKIEGKSESETVINIVDNPVFNVGENFDFSDVASIIQKIKGTDSAHKGRRFSEIYEILKNPDNLWMIDDATKLLVEEFKQFTREEFFYITPESIKNLEMALGITILRLSRVFRLEKTPNNFATENVSYKSSFSYIYELSEVQKIPGCNGGGKKPFIKSISPRIVNVNNQEWFTCPKCSYKADGPIGNSACPGCGLTKEAYLEETGVVCD